MSAYEKRMADALAKLARSECAKRDGEAHCEPPRRWTDTIEPSLGEFHWRDGLTFKPLACGCVRIALWTQDEADGKWFRSPLAFIPSSEWDSIVDSSRRAPGVTGEPAAWAVTDDEGEVLYSFPDKQDAEECLRPHRYLVPLYRRSPVSGGEPARSLTTEDMRIVALRVNDGALRHENVSVNQIREIAKILGYHAQAMGEPWCAAPVSGGEPGENER